LHVFPLKALASPDLTKTSLVACPRAAYSLRKWKRNVRGQAI
jgi:hypothetical protein